MFVFVAIDVLFLVESPHSGNLQLIAAKQKTPPAFASGVVNLDSV
jgi:hypothetical protein